jgi:hypothetical protein
MIDDGTQDGVRIFWLEPGDMQREAVARWVRRHGIDPADVAEQIGRMEGWFALSDEERQVTFLLMHRDADGQPHPRDQCPDGLRGPYLAVCTEDRTVQLEGRPIPPPL